MLQDIHDFNRDQWDTAIQGNWKSKSRPIIKDPALYTQALEWMNLHLSMPAPATPSLPSMD